MQFLTTAFLHVTRTAHGALFVFASLNAVITYAQDDLMAELNSAMPKERNFVYATFKGTRVVNLHTVETLGKKTLEFRIAHRFGDFSSGGKNLWGLDGPATIQFHFDYGITDRITVGVGRASFHKMFDAYGKYNLLRQTTDNSIPFSATLLGSVNVISDDDQNQVLGGVDGYEDLGNRVAYLAQGLIARKLNSKLSLQIAPMYIHYNLAMTYGAQNDVFALGFSGRYKLSSHAAFTSEYIYRLNTNSINSDVYSNVLSMGFDLETGGHVFQVFVTNSLAINEVTAVPFTTSRWSKEEIRLGFNIARTFGNHKKTKS